VAAPITLELKDIHKSFGDIRANDGITMRLSGGSIHGLLGENGAGKSTLMKILSGYIGADSGEIVLGGAPLRMASPRDATRAGIGMLHQDPLVFLPFTAIDNLLLGSPGGRFLDRSEGNRVLARMRERFGFALQPDVLARNLTVGERQQLEIVRLLSLGVKVLILDEPTTGISADQRTTLFETLRSLASEGMTVIFVSHKLEEVEAICDDVVVMRRGKVVGAASLPASTDRLVEMMFGAIVGQPEPVTVDPGGLVLSIEDATITDRGLSTSLSLTVRGGEIVGLAGLEGSGQRTLLRACAGLVGVDQGRVLLDGREVTGRPYRSFLDAGVSYMPAGRLEEGLLSGMTIAEHVALVTGTGGFVVDWREANAEAERRMRRFSIRGTPATTADALSGGNQQRLLLSLTPPNVRLLLMEHPTRGLDIASADWVWTQLLERKRDGTAIVFSSADLDELLRYSDRILVFFTGQVLRVLEARGTSGEELGRLIGGKDRPP
jgi:simple sugar transport system ATP-binding protein